MQGSGRTKKMIESIVHHLILSQYELAEAAGTGDVCWYELGKITPSLSVLMKLSLAFHCELGDLIYDNKENDI